MKELSQFQIDLADEVNRELFARGLTHTVREIKGVVLGYPVLDVNVFVHALEMDIWIYEDEAQFFVRDKVDERFELPDFNSTGKLAKEFLAALCRYLDSSGETTLLL